MESTLLTLFLKTLKIKWWLENPQNPSVMKEIKSLFDKTYSPGAFDKNSEIIELMDDDNVSAKFLEALSAPKLSNKFFTQAKPWCAFMLDSNAMVLFTLSQKHTKETARSFTTQMAILLQSLL